MAISPNRMSIANVRNQLQIIVVAWKRQNHVGKIPAAVARIVKELEVLEKRLKRAERSQAAD